jgi:thiamine biosynthesis lipoprotein
MLTQTQPAAQATHLAMGTVMSHRTFGAYAEDGLAAVCREIDRLEGLLSRFLPRSDISRVNASAGFQSEKISSETCQVLSRAVDFSRAYPGCFDVTVGPLVDLWSEARQRLSSPDEASIRQALWLSNARDVMLDPWEMTAGLRNFGQGIDLGGIGKGFAGDRLMNIYREYGVTSACSNLGGNVVALGAKPDGSAWQVGIQHPRAEDRLLGTVAVIDETVVTSGDYQRCFIDDQGKRRHHILDPKTGYPAESGLVSATVVAENSMTADALSTILFIAGLEKAAEIMRGLVRTEAVLVDNDLRVYVTRGLIDRFRADQGIDVIFLD